ncbi:post-transcriptional regulator [Thalassobacillus sp. CUG 92003]|uniref:post-transcriptional regulator n=1 Tax=Thalassobacillus sp. CUG 92003 TaxID=2736641 RepID=UPI0015E69581
MEEYKYVSEWKSVLGPALQSKAEELMTMGYARATQEDVWNCLKKKVWKGDPEKRLHQVVQDIMHLSSNLYMSYLTVSAYQDDDLMASINALTESAEDQHESK